MLRRLPSFDPEAMKMKKSTPELLDTLAERGDDGGVGWDTEGKNE